MKNFFAISISAVMLAALCSCSGEPAAEPVKGNVRYPENLRITAGSEKLSSAGKSWNGLDTLVVFDKDNGAVKFLTSSDGTASTAVFGSDGWTGKEPVYASVSDVTEYASCTSEGVLTVNLEPDQTASAPESCPDNVSAFVGKVSADVDDCRIGQMKTAVGFIRVPFIKADISSITAAAPGGEALAGTFDVDYVSMADGNSAFWTPSAVGVISHSVTLVPSKHCFTAGAWCFAVLPQKYSKGIDLTFRGADGNVLYAYNVGGEEGLTVGRNETVTVETPHVDPLPETITISLDFYNETNVNPLGFETPAAAAENATDGEDYTMQYEYMFRGQKKTEDLTFTVCKGTGASSARYYYSAPGSMTYGTVGRKILIFTATNGWIKVPAIEGRYLQSVTLSHGNGAPKQMQIKPDIAGKTILAYTSKAASQIATKDHLNTQTCAFYSNSASKTEMGKPYYLYFASGASLRVYNITLVYTKELPVK